MGSSRAWIRLYDSPLAGPSLAAGSQAASNRRGTAWSARFRLRDNGMEVENLAASNRNPVLGAIAPVFTAPAQLPSAESAPEPQPEPRARRRSDEQSQPITDAGAPAAFEEHLGGLDRRCGERGISAEEARREDLLPCLGNEGDSEPRDQADEEGAAEVDQRGAPRQPAPADPGRDRAVDPGAGGRAHTPGER